jgi:HEAT repeat protein
VSITNRLVCTRLLTDADGAVIALNDEDARVHREAVGVLGWLKQTEALDALARLASEDPDTDVRRAATWQVRLRATRSLGRLRYVQALPGLIETLGHSISNLRNAARFDCRG